MKNPICISLVLLGCAFVVPAATSGATNNLFHTIDTTHPILSSLDPHAFGPSSDDPDGHWGGVISGLSLSLRFQETSLLQGEPMNAVLLIRNETNKETVYQETFGMGAQSVICDFAVTNLDTKTGLPGRRTGPVTGHIEFNRLQPFQQVLYVVRLDQLFDFSPGRYSIQATKRLITGPHPPALPLASGVAHITIVEAPPGSKGEGILGGGTNTPSGGLER